MVILSRIGNRLLSLGALALVLSMLTACECVDCTELKMATVPSYIDLAPIAPPARQAEYIPVIDNPQTEIWRPGYWSWDGAIYSWVPGEVINRPAPTAVWSPDYWLQHDYGWGFVSGYWQ